MSRTQDRFPRAFSRVSFSRALLALALSVTAVACGSSYSNPTSTTPAGGSTGATSTADVTVTILGMKGAGSFSPSPAKVAVGQTVAWHNSDSVTHTATGSTFDTGPIAPGATSAPVTFSTAATYDYRCTIHPSMTGSVQVGGSTTHVGY